MRAIDTRSRRLILKALLLLWVVGCCTPCSAAADARATVFNESSPKFGGGDLNAPSLSAVFFEELDSSEVYVPEAHGSGADGRRADLYTLVKLAVDELEFLAGVRIMWNQAEKTFDNLALRLRLKGDLSFDRNKSPSGRPRFHSDAAVNHASSSRSKFSRTPLSLQSIFIPHKVRWNFGFDPNDQVAFGELKWGSFIALQSDVGAHQQVKMVFEYDF